MLINKPIGVAIVHVGGITAPIGISYDAPRHKKIFYAGQQALIGVTSHTL
jgi:hypothetical protein